MLFHLALTAFSSTIVLAVPMNKENQIQFYCLMAFIGVYGLIYSIMKITENQTGDYYFIEHKVPTPMLVLYCLILSSIAYLYYIEKLKKFPEWIIITSWVDLLLMVADKSVRDGIMER